MEWKDVGGLLARVAPTIAAAAGGPLAGSAVSAIEGALGLTKANPGELGKRQTEVAAAISGATPEQLLALRQADHAFAEHMAELGFKDTEALAQLSVADRDSARKREQATGDVTPRLLAAGVTVGFFGVLSFMLGHAIPEGSRDVVNILLGSLGTAWISVVAYYFGSSAGSAQKTELLAKSGPVS